MVVRECQRHVELQHRLRCEKFDALGAIFDKSAHALFIKVVTSLILDVGERLIRALHMAQGFSHLSVRNPEPAARTGGRPSIKSGLFCHHDFQPAAGGRNRSRHACHTRTDNQYIAVKLICYRH